MAFYARKVCTNPFETSARSFFHPSPRMHLQADKVVSQAPRIERASEPERERDRERSIAAFVDITPTRRCRLPDMYTLLTQERSDELPFQFFCRSRRVKRERKRSSLGRSARAPSHTQLARARINAATARLMRVRAVEDVLGARSSDIPLSHPIIRARAFFRHSSSASCPFARLARVECVARTFYIRKK